MEGLLSLNRQRRERQLLPVRNTEYLSYSSGRAPSVHCLYGKLRLMSKTGQMSPKMFCLSIQGAVGNLVQSRLLK